MQCDVCGKPATRRGVETRELPKTDQEVKLTRGIVCDKCTPFQESFWTATTTPKWFTIERLAKA